MMCWSKHIISVDADHESDVEDIDRDDVGVVAEHVAAQYLLRGEASTIYEVDAGRW